jgi:hypothetical protein
MPTDIVNEVVSTYHIYNDPALWQAIGGLAIVLLLLYWRYRFPDSYKRTKRGILHSLDTATQVANVFGFVISLSIIGILALYNYGEKTVVAIQTSSPELFAFVSGYKETAMIVLAIYMAFFFAWNIVARHWNNLPNGVIEDADQKLWDDRKQLEDIGRDMRIEEVEKNRQISEERWQKAFEKLTEMYVASQNAIYDIKGEKEGRLEENPETYTGPEKRSIVTNPTVPLTKEVVLAKIHPVTDPIEDPLPPENISESEEKETEATKKPENDYYKDSKLDQAVLTGIKKVFK